MPPASGRKFNPGRLYHKYYWQSLACRKHSPDEAEEDSDSGTHGQLMIPRSRVPCEELISEAYDGEEYPSEEEIVPAPTPSIDSKLSYQRDDEQA